MKSILFITCIFLFASAGANNSFSIKTVVIDAGHGGKDPGASGPGKTREKDIALQVALKLGENISKNFPDVNVIYTRKTDVFIELHERAEIANRAKADLFIAVHCNSSTNPEFYGTSTYVLGLHRTEANLEVAKRENAVILLEEDRDKNYEFDPNSPEGHIIMSMKQNAFLDQSIDFASKVETQFENNARRKSMGVKQAGFYVLYKTTMPSLLAEIGFISNPEEEKFLLSSKGQEQIANSLFNAFKNYKVQMEGNATGKADNAPASQPEPVKVETKEEPKPVKKETEQVKEKPVVKNEPEPAPAANSNTVTLKDGRNIRKPTETSNGGGKLPPKADVTVVKKEEKAVVTETSKEEPEVKPEPIKKEEPKPVVKKEEPAPVVKKEEPAPVVKKEEPKPVVVEKKPEPKPVVKEEKVVVKAPVKEEPVAAADPNRLVPLHKAESGTIFKVQMFALKGELKEYNKVVTKVSKILSAEELPNGLTRYYCGNTKTYAEAKRILDAAKANGYTVAYIVGFKDGVRMSAEQLKAFE
ncbi:MAG TPA: N-acetylmuramoyl-L-alanine amidase [Chitinophagales bacterium]|nr:N-acetylmuramoyl-L-alanine amidase [Chitinophagales bacterium]